MVYTSEELQGYWKKGFVTVGDLTLESAAYVARYITKKITGEMAEQHYTKVNPYTGELYFVQPEYVTMSTRPPIGRSWLDKYGSDAYRLDSVIVKGHARKLPRYYDKQFELTDPELHETTKQKRKVKNRKRKHDQTPHRLQQREKVKRAQISKLKRPIEDTENETQYIHGI